jgi:cytochrome c-type biogenesis protein
LQGVPMYLFESPALVLPLLFVLGIITSLSPCILSLTPVLLGYIGGYGENRRASFIMSVFFVTGLGITFAILGVAASYLGTIFGQIGTFWYAAAALIAITMGLNLLEVIHINLPGLKRLPFKATSPMGALLLGAAFGLVASPCSTPVLAAILSFVAVQQRILYGGLLLFVYGVGHGTPLIIIGSFAFLLKELPYLQARSKYFTYTSGIILILLGLYLLYKFL